MTLPAQKCICSGIHIRTTVYKTQNATPDCANRRQSRRCIATICYTHRENDDVDGRASVTKDEERVLRGGWTVMRLCRYEGCQDFVSKWEKLVFNALGVTVHQRRHLFSTPNYYYYCCCARLKASFPGQHAWAGTRKVKPSVDLNEAREGGVWDAVASAGPYANNLHLASDRQPHQHLTTRFLQTGSSSWRPTNSVKALKA